MSKKVAVVLSGCGFMDGSEINEAIFTLLALSQAGVAYQCVAPDIAHHHVSDYITGEQVGETRSVLKESARIARGKVINVADADINDYAAVIFPGGFGAATTLCDFAEQGADMVLQPDVQAFAKDCYQQKKPMGFICIAPVLAPKIVPGACVTIGNDKETAQKIVAMGGQHVDTVVTDICIDKQHKIVSTPAFMLSDQLSDVYVGIKKLVDMIVQIF